MADETQNSGAATASQDTSTDEQNAGVDTNQSNNGGDKQAGNSAVSDEQDGAAQGSDTRQRPSRSERRIGALHSELAEALSKAEAAETENNRLKAMLETPVGDRVKMPDYSNVDQVSPEQLKQDIINTADQIVKLRLEEGLKQNAQQLTQKQANDRVLSDIDTVIAGHSELNPEDAENYDEDLEKYLVGSFQRAYKGDNTYRLKDHVDAYFRQNRGQAKTNNSNAANDKSVAAVRGNAGRSTSGGKSVDQMSSAEFLTYVKGGGKV